MRITGLAAQIADLLEEAFREEETEILGRVHADPELEADVFEELGEEQATRLLGARTAPEIAAVLSRMRADDDADAIGELPQSRRKPVLDLLPAGQRSRGPARSRHLIAVRRQGRTRGRQVPGPCARSARDHRPRRERPMAASAGNAASGLRARGSVPDPGPRRTFENCTSEAMVTVLAPYRPSAPRCRERGLARDRV